MTIYKSWPFVAAIDDCRLNFGSKTKVSHGDTDLAIFATEIQIRIDITVNGSRAQPDIVELIGDTFLEGSYWANEDWFSEVPRNIVVGESRVLATLVVGQLDETDSCRRYLTDLVLTFNFELAYEEEGISRYFGDIVVLANYCTASLVLNTLGKLAPLVFPNPKGDLDTQRPFSYRDLQEMSISVNSLTRHLGLQSVSTLQQLGNVVTQSHGLWKLCEMPPSARRNQHGSKVKSASPDKDLHRQYIGQFFAIPRQGLPHTPDCLL